MLAVSISPKKKKVVQVRLLSGEEIRVPVDVKSKFHEVFNAVVIHLGLRETEYFGLSLCKDGEYHFVNLDEKIHKQAPKAWKSEKGDGLDDKRLPLLTVYFRVQFYVDEVCLLREKVTRHLYYLQLKENVLNYRHLCSEERCFQLAAFALQADFGNYYPEKHQPGNYFDPREYFPAWMVGEHGQEYLFQNAPKMHKEQQDVTKNEAELKYIRESIKYPAAHNLHFYRMKKKKTDKIWNAWLGICPKGVEIYEEMKGNFKNLLSTFLWPDIEKLYFDKKKFEIRSVGRPEGRKFTYYTESDAKSKYILSICRNTHMFHLELEPKLMEIRHLQAEDKRRYRESYIYSDARDLVVNGGLVPYCAAPSTSSGRSGTGVVQRCSVISDTSSNTTSGIVSDKVTVSFDENDDNAREIIIDSPPRANVLGTPNQSRNKFTIPTRETVTNLQDYMLAAPVSSNRSPKFDNGPMDLYKSTNRSGNSPNSKTNCPHSPLSQTNSSGSYRNHLLPQQQQQQQQQQPPQPQPPPPSQQQQQQTSQSSPQAQSVTPPAPSNQQILYSNKIPLKYAITGAPQPALPQSPSPCEKPSKPISRSVSRRDSFKQHRLLHVEPETAIETPTLPTESPKTDPSANIYSLPPPLPVSHTSNKESRMLPKNMVSIPSINYSPPSSNQNLTSTTNGIDHVVAPWATSAIRPVPLDSVPSWAAANGLPPSASDKLGSTQMAGAWANSDTSVQEAWNKNLADQIASSMSTNTQWKNLPPDHSAWPADAIPSLVSNDCRGFNNVESIGPKHSLPDILRGELPSQRPNDASLLNALPTPSAVAPSSTAAVCDAGEAAFHTDTVTSQSVDKCSGGISTEHNMDPPTSQSPEQTSLEANQHQAQASPSSSQPSAQSASVIQQQQQLAVGGVTTAESEGANINQDAKPKSPTKISLKNQKEILHPELEKIRTEANRNSVPFITALFNDHSLMQNSTGSFCSTDTGTMKSTDSRHSQASNHDTDARRIVEKYFTPGYFYTAKKTLVFLPFSSLFLSLIHNFNLSLFFIPFYFQSLPFLEFPTCFSSILNSF
ncbi:unnamed protein product [Acanthosepion pharaonis]|uniref:FERM domain-containing protein n=1 Tax=Acanthosepion pharaonis TaxID=158019 RepID=A0A812D1N1_ACAPH|nr:unnamed protein product [Sepia pharaonis]